MSTPLPSPEELDRLLAIHHRPRGPLTVDGDALARVRRWVAQERPAFRFVVKLDRSVELTAEELHHAFAELVEDGRTIRQRGRRLAMESDSEPAEQLQRIFREVAAPLWQLLDRRCSRCRSTTIQLESSPRHPGWKIACRQCRATLRRPKSIC